MSCSDRLRAGGNQHAAVTVWDGSGRAEAAMVGGGAERMRSRSSYLTIGMADR